MDAATYAPSLRGSLGGLYVPFPPAALTLPRPDGLLRQARQWDLYLLGVCPTLPQIPVLFGTVPIPSLNSQLILLRNLEFRTLYE
ncbi:jg2209 [Pararge aegeria aegeria]|uniref:Jg2209 protein n=1 Tax=Pararge aegeria aegeria TaxID=348720 RepID=A0A8S4QLD7_9NEOP|nr:jg2209 [Pararge aegeria aegeria]